MNPTKLYTVKEAAKVVGVSTNTLYKYLDEGRIKAARGSAVQGRFRIPETALEEFLGVKLSQPEPIESVGATFTVARELINDPQSPGQVQDLPLQTSKLPLKITRLLLILALCAMLVDVVITQTVTVATQVTRFFFIIIMLILSYGEGGFRRN